MAKEFAKAFYHSKRWQVCRGAYIDYRVSVDGGLCETCGQAQGVIVHHRILLTPDNINDYSITLSFDNLKLDCKACHDREDAHFIQPRKNKLPYRFGNNGEILPP